MSTVGSLAVNIVGNSEGFTRATRSARNELKLLQTGVGAVKGVLIGFGATLAAGFTLGALKGAADEIDRLGDDMVRLGIAPDKLQGLERFAQLSGASAEAMVAGLGKMETAIAKGSAGFAKLNLNAAELKTLKPEEAFLRIADAVKAIGNPHERMAAVRDVFGKGGATLMPTIMEGASAIEQGMNKFGSVNEDQVKAIQAANDALDELSMAFADLKVLLVSALVPAMTDFIKTTTSLISGRPDDNGRYGAGLMATPGVTEGVHTPLYTQVLDKLSDDAFRKLQHDYKQRDRELEKTNSGERLSELVQRMTGIATGNFDATTFATAMYKRQDKMNEASVARHKALGVDDPERVAREQAAAAKQQQLAADLTMSAFGVMGGAMARNVDEFAGQDDNKALARKELDRLDAHQKRITDMGVVTSTALEKGTAAAFSQERRSSQAGQLLENAKKQLAELKGVREQLKKIADTGLGKFPVFDLAGGT